MLGRNSLLQLACLLAVSVCFTGPNCTPNYRVIYPVSATYVDSSNAWWGSGILAAIGVPGYAIEPIGYNMFVLAFWLCGQGAVDMAGLWAKLSTYGLPAEFGTTNDQIQKKLKGLYNARNIRILASAFGSTEFPTSSGLDAMQCGTKYSQFIMDNNLDGGDVDWEDNAAMEAGTGEAWIIIFSQTMRKILPKHLITHAPQGPYFKQEFYRNGAYITVDKKVGHMIDLYLTQFYNQEDTTYSTFSALFQSSGAVFSGTSVMEVVGRGVPANKIVIGKPVTQADASNTGTVSAADLANFFGQGYDKYHWYAGLMTWQYYHDLDSSFANTVMKPLITRCKKDMNCL